ncbi:unnamed protein product [Cunninghamella echinulata]
MKFSYSLKFNAIPDWFDKYLSYDDLKKLIFDLEKEKVKEWQDAEKGLSTKNDDLENTFINALDQQLEKILEFYTTTESEIYTQLDLFNSEHHQSSSLRESIDSNSIYPPQQDMDQLTTLQHQLIQLFISLVDLQSYIELNRIAFDKILKKYDKLLNGNLRETYMNQIVLESRPFLSSTIAALHQQIEIIESYYAHYFCDDNISLATQQMKSNLRPHIKVNRTTATVFKNIQFIQSTHKLEQDIVITTTSPILPSSHHQQQQQYDQQSTLFFFFKHPIIYLKTVSPTLLRQWICFTMALIVFIILLNVDMFGNSNQQENRCFALLLFAAILWATEAIPLYATSLMIPFLIILLGIMRHHTTDGSPMTAHEASKVIFSAMFSSTIMMLLGGFALASALSKYGIAKAFATHVLSRAGTQPKWILLTIMFIAGFLSMWISNVATPVLCFSLIQPILRTLPDHQTIIGSCLILGIALACCIGGQMSPISSPQNIITLQYLNPTPNWGIWFAVALPISILSILCCWFLLLIVYKPDHICSHINSIQPTSSSSIAASSNDNDNSHFKLKQSFILCITLLTILLWCLESTLESYLGSSGVIATIPLFLFFGTGLLNKEDLNAFLWSVVILAQGGMALGEAVTSSGLLQDIALHIKLSIANFHPMAILAIFSLLILVFSTFVSHTVAALILIPIVQQVGQHLPIPHPNLLVMGAGLACSTGMSLPVSGFPNMSAIMLETPYKKPYLTTKDFIIIGVPTSIFCTILVFTLGYGIMVSLGF